MSEPEEFIEECRKMFNHICLYMSDEIGRLIGFALEHDDYYYIIRKCNGQLEYSSCVGGCESLKGKIDRYDALEQMYTYNQCPPEKEFMLHCQERDIDTSKYDLLSEVGLAGEWDKEEEARKWRRVKEILYV
jgi:hypothetical protein